MSKQNLIDTVALQTSTSKAEAERIERAAAKRERKRMKLLGSTLESVLGNSAHPVTGDNRPWKQRLNPFYVNH